MSIQYGKMKILLVMLIVFCFSIGIAAANTPKNIMCAVKKSDGTTPPAAADVVIKVTDAAGQIATYGTDTSLVTYSEEGGMITIVLGNFTQQWVAGDSIKVEVTSGTAGTQDFEFGDTTEAVDTNGSNLQIFTGFSLTASQRNMTKTAGDAQSQVYSTELATDLEVTVVDDLGDPVVGETPTATGDGSITSFSATDVSGKTTATWTLGAAIGSQTMTVSLSGYSDAVFTATATAGHLASYSVDSTAFDGTAGATNTITVTAKDSGGNTITDYTGVAAFTSTDSAATLPGDYTYVSGDNGVKTFNVTIKTAGEQSVTVTTGDVTGSVSGPVVPAAASKVDLKTSEDTVASGGIGTATLTATIQDDFGNTVTAESGSVDYTVTGADTTNAGWTTKTETLTNGVATATFTTTGDVAGDGSVDVDVTAGKDALTTGTVTLTIVNFSVTPSASNAAIGDTINLAVEGAQGTVSWKVTGDAGVGTLGSYTGDNKENAVFTVVKAGNATITVTEGSKESKATVTAYNNVAITDKPSSSVTVKAGKSSDTYSVTGGDSDYTWSVAGPVAVDGSTSSTFTFEAPESGAYAGEYTVSVTDDAGTNVETFKVYVPLTIDPDDEFISVLANADPYPFTLTGAADTTPYTLTIASLDDDMDDSLTNGTFNAQNVAAYAFDPTAYTVTTDTGSKEYSLAFDVKDLDAPTPSKTYVTVRPVKTTTFNGVVSDVNGFVTGAKVTLISPAKFADKENPVVTDATGAFTFGPFTAIKYAVFLVKVESDGYVSQTGIKLNKDGDTTVTLVPSSASVSGDVGANVAANVSIYSKDEKLAGPVKSSAEDGTFKLELETALSEGENYTVTASTDTKSGSAGVTGLADTTAYTNVAITMADTGGDIPPGVEFDFKTVGSAPGDADEFTKAFGSEKILITVTPKADGSKLADPEPLVYTETQEKVKSGWTWEFAGLSDGDCVTIQVPCSLEDAIAVQEETKVVWYQHTDDAGNIEEWAQAAVDTDLIVYNGDNSRIPVEFCNWSSNLVGIGEPESSVPSSDDSSSGCFISTLSASASSSSMMVFAAFLFIIAAGVLISVSRKQKSN